MLVNIGFGRSYNYSIFFIIHGVAMNNFKLNMERSFENENTYDGFMNK